MPRDANGNYTAPIGNPVVTGTVIESVWANDTVGDIGTELSNSLDRNGRGGMLAALKVVDGVETVPGLSFINQIDAGLWRAAVDDWYLVVAGNGVFRVQPNLLTAEVPLDAVGITIQGDTVVTENNLPPATIISDTPPPTPVAGTTWYESDTGRFYIYYVDADSSQWIEVAPGLLNSKPTLTLVPFTATGAGLWTKPVGLKYAIVEVAGPGGGGGGAGATGAAAGSVGSGGGAGGYSRKILLAEDLGATEQVFVGTGGNGGNGGVPGSPGSAATTFGAHVSANPGIGGNEVANSTLSNAVSGAGGGAASANGDINVKGGGGGAGIINVEPGVRSGAMSGSGGNSFFGGGAQGRGVSNVTSLDGLDGGAPGAGGGGAANGSSQTFKAGGDGFDGICIVTEYV